jgi:hypoxanthine phosphoribosyltransferase
VRELTFAAEDIEPLIDEKTLQARIAELGQNLTQEYAGKPLTLVGVLKGSLFFLADLARAIDLPLTVELLGVSSYAGGTETTGEVRITSDVTRPLAGQHVLVVEDIVDTGLTMNFLMNNLRARQPASVKVCALLVKPSRARVPVHVDHRGFTVDDIFLVGYGLDYGERYRNLPYVGRMKRTPVNG